MADSLPSLPESVINVPIRIGVKPLLDKAETLAPLEFTSEQWPGYTQQGCDFRYKYRFVRSALHFTCVDSRVSISLTGSYQVAGSRSACILGKQVAPWLSGSCGFGGEPLRRANITLVSTLRFLPNYTLRSRSTVETVQPVDKCAVGFLNTDITGLVMNTVRSSMTAFTSSLDRDIARLNPSSLIRSIETGLTKKISLGNYGHLAVQPGSVKIGKISYATDTLSFTAGFSCRLVLSAAITQAATRVRLPPLTSTELNNGMALYVNATYGYPFVGQLLTRSVQQKIFSIRKERISIDSIEVKGSENGTVELKALFSGSKRGILYLTGKPVLDTSRQLITVPDLRFSLRSKSFVLNAGKSFFNKKILRTIRQQATIDINKVYQQNKPLLDKAMTHQYSPTVSSTGNTEQLAIRGMVLKKDEILLQVFLKGNGGVVVVLN